MKIINLKKEKPEQAIQKAIAVLKKGGLIIYPTETCYGLGTDTTNPQAVKKLLQYKGGRGKKPISVAVANQTMAKKYVKINETAENLYQNFLPGPLTVVSQGKGKVTFGLESASQTLGIRIPDYPLILKLIAQFGKPITATSANTSGKKQPHSLADWQRYTSGKKQTMIDLFLDAGRLPKREPSTVVDTTLNEPTVLRQGKIKIPQIAGQIFVSNSEKETKTIAKEIFKRYQNLLNSSPLIFALQGELGSGKTQFVKGLATTLNIKTNVPSPTYIFVREYLYQLDALTGVLYHIDTWRMEKGEELLELGLKKMLKPGNVIAIEWLQKVKKILEKIAAGKKAKVIWLEIETLSPTKRRIKYQI
ncbi:MAG TPA: L-threonylcarbamoyladenylate synthase [Nevskiaceae bacterium]|nr:L-threonylcarbamoyladenylate synthase [Nevskiaceae bacterium]